MNRHPWGESLPLMPILKPYFNRDFMYTLHMVVLKICPGIVRHGMYPSDFFFFSVEKLIFTALVDNSVLFWHQLHSAHFTPWSVQISLTRKALNLMTEWQNKTFPEQNSRRMLPYTTSYFLIALAKQQPKTMPTTSMKQMMMPVTPTYTIFSLNFSRRTSIQFLW